MASESLGPRERIGETAWSRNRFFGPRSGVRDTGNKRGTWKIKVSDPVPPITKVRIGEICNHRNGFRYRFVQLLKYMHTFIINNVYNSIDTTTCNIRRGEDQEIRMGGIGAERMESRTRNNMMQVSVGW